MFNEELLFKLVWNFLTVEQLCWQISVWIADCVCVHVCVFQGRVGGAAIHLNASQTCGAAGVPPTVRWVLTQWSLQFLILSLWQCSLDHNIFTHTHTHLSSLGAMETATTLFHVDLWWVDVLRNIIVELQTSFWLPRLFEWYSWG